MLIYILAQSTDSGGSGNEIVTIVYILTGISLIIGFIVGTYKYVQRQKKKWTEEGITRQKQDQTVKENSAQLQKNTEATDRLTGEFGKFAERVIREMGVLGERVDKLETWRQRKDGVV